MDLTARPHAAAAAALVAAGLVAAAPVAGAGLAPTAGLRDVQLTSTDAAGLLEQLETGGLKANSALIEGFEGINHKISSGEHGLIHNAFDKLGTSDSDYLTALTHGLKEGLYQFFDGNHALAGIGETSLLSLLGATGTVGEDGFSPLDLAQFNGTLFLDDNHTASFPYSGLESAFAHYFGAVSFIGAGLFGIDGEKLEGSDVGTGFTGLAGGIANFNTDLVQSELAFNHNLVNFETGVEQALFGDDSAANGVFNRAFNTFNLFLGTQQQLLNGVIGVTGQSVDPDTLQPTDDVVTPHDLVHSLLTGSDAQTFNGGEIGGLQGMFDQSAAMWADVFGLFQNDDDSLTHLFSNFDPNFGALGTAFTGFFEGLGGVFEPFGDLFTL